MPAQSESDTPDERAGEIGGVGDGCAGRTDFEFSLACECEAVPGANDGTRGDDNRSQAEERKRDNHVRREQPGERNRPCGRDVSASESAP
jgi:hypothetical protein